VSTFPYWSNAVTATVNVEPADGVGVDGDSLNELNIGAGTVTGPLELLVAVHERKTAVTA
jgi:hypothetical protein